MVRALLNKSMELKNKFKRENGRDELIGLIDTPSRNKNILLNDSSIHEEDIAS